MREFWLNIERILRQPGQGLVKIIALNCGIFILLMIFRLISILSGHSLAYDSLLESLTLSSQYSHILQAPWSLISYFLCM